MLSRRRDGREEAVASFLTGERALYYEAMAGRMPEQYFEVFADRRDGPPKTVLMRVIGTWFVELGMESDLDEVGAFLDLAAKSEVTGNGVEQLRLKGIDRTLQVPFLRFAGETECSNRVEVCESLSALQELYRILKEEEIFEMPSFEEFYVIRRLLCQKGVARIRGIRVDGRVVAGAQTLCESPHGAMLGMVVTDAAYRRRGLSAEVLRVLLSELRERTEEIAIAAYHPGALALYHKLGFVETGVKTCLRFYSSRIKA